MLVNNRNIYNFTDYDNPILCHKTDYRTAYTRAYQNYNSPSFKTVPDIIYQIKKCEHESKSNPYKYLSQYKVQCDWKYQTNLPSDNASLPINCNRLNFLKSVNEKITYKNVKPIKEFQTVNNVTYCEKNLNVCHQIKPDYLTKKPDRPAKEITANEPSFLKHLDPYLTINLVNHVPYTEIQQFGIAKKDNISVWDWLEYPKTKKGYGLKNYPVKHKVQSTEPIFDKMVFNSTCYDKIKLKPPQFVKNFGLTTEVSSNFKDTVTMKFNDDFYKVKPLSFSNVEPKTDVNTEYKIYGSGKKIHSILDARGHRTFNY